MSSVTPTSSGSPARPLAFRRAPEQRWLLGVARGFADQHGVDPLVVRGALAVLSLAGGIGIVLYVVGALLTVGVHDTTVLPGAHPRDVRRDVAVGSITAGLLLVVRSTGLWLGDQVMAPFVALAAGFVLLGLLHDDAERGQGFLGGLVDGRHARVRIVGGAALIAGGLMIVGFGNGLSGGVRVGVFATAVTILGVGVVVGPWLARAAQSAAEERRERIRVHEREAMAAHLHDSVLQTLALIQRNADDPRRTVTLARQQERELRTWLYGTDRRAGAAPATGGSLAGAVRDAGAEVEAAYDVRIEVVVVGDAPLDDDLADLVAATREACVNAAKHAGVGEVAVYVEVSPGAVEVFVRDRGRGFVRDDVPADRRGLAQSIEGRVARRGGTVTVDTAPGRGTEVRLVLPRTAPPSGSSNGGGAR